MPALTPLTNSLNLVVQPCDSETGRQLHHLGFAPIPSVCRLLYRQISHHELSELFLKISQALSEDSQSRSRYCITRSPLDSTALLVEFLEAQPLSTITESVKYAWFLQILAKQQLFFKFQPIFDLKRGTVIAYECLARARSNEGLCFSGKQLMDAAVSLRLTREFDDLARMTCLEEIAQMCQKHPFQKPLTFFINTLPNTLTCNPHTFEQTIQSICDLGLQPQQIVFELTEIEAVTNSPELARMINQLRQWGFGVAIDDLCGNVAIDHYFMEFQPDVIKIDRRLVHGCSRYKLKQIMLKSLLHSAHELGIMVLAEGLESAADIDFCRQLNVDYGQGFGLALPDRSLQSNPINLLKFSNAC